MNHQEQIKQFSNELTKLIERMKNEYDLPVCSVIGALYITIDWILTEAKESK